MVAGSLRNVMLAADGAGVLERPDARTGSAEHPSCGDRVEIDIALDGDEISDLRWRARGCPASLAVAAAARGALVGASVRDAPALLQRRIESLGGLANHERHALPLFLSALRRAAALRD
ncbi:MAG: hypothetical protein Fur0037_08670 [Planctomycetota bacterium]